MFFQEIVDASRPDEESETAKFLKSLEVDQREVRHPSRRVHGADHPR